MKKFLILLLFLATACSSQSGTETSSVEVPTVEVTVVRPTENPYNQLNGSVTFVYEYSEELPSGWIVDDVESEKIVFSRLEDGSWSTEKARPEVRDFGPLFPGLIHSYLTTTKGSCGINTYFSDSLEEKGEVSFQPICVTIGEGEEAVMVFGLDNCEKDGSGNLICSLETDSGTLFYSFDPDFEKFQFTYSGTWNYDYPGWITESLALLGFEPIPSDFFDQVLPGANYSWYKNPKLTTP